MSKNLIGGIIIIILLSLIYLFGTLADGSPRLILNMWNDKKLPRNFRVMDQEFQKKHPLVPSKEGLSTLQASGSSQFSEKGLDAILANLPNPKITIVDLREESHGFINDIAISWYSKRDWANEGKTFDQIIKDENSRLENLSKHKFGVMFLSHKKLIPTPFWVKTAENESQICKKKELGYLRLPVRDHIKPTDQTVDEFIRFVMSLPKDTWLHFHCLAGEGRTTVFLTMYDMMRNATKVSMNDIYQRQWLLGGMNFLEIQDPKDWRTPYAIERKNFLNDFYQYCRSNPHFQQSWSSWKNLK